MKKIFSLIFILLCISCAWMPVTKDNLDKRLDDFATKAYVQNAILDFQLKIKDGYATKEDIQEFSERLAISGSISPDNLAAVLALLESTGTNKIRAFTATHGGASGALDSISCLDLTTNDLGLVFRVSDGYMLFYKYDSTATAPEETTNYTVIEPDDVDANCSGEGNWELMEGFVWAGSATPTINFKDSDQAHQTIASISANATDANDSTVSLKVEEDTSLTEYVELDGVNERVDFAKLINTTDGLMINVVVDADGGTMSAAQANGTIWYATGAGTITLPPVVAGMSFTVITIGAVAVVIQPDETGTSDTITLDGTDLAAGDTVTNTSTTGDMLVCSYYKADFWYCASGSNDGDPWTDTN